MQQLVGIAASMAEEEAHIASLEEQLKEAKKAYQVIRTRTLPDLMVEIGIEEVVHEGNRFTLKDFISGSIPNTEHRKAQALKWLEANGGESIIKTKISMDFGRGEHESAEGLRAELESEGHAPRMEESVHAMTLKAWARERLQDGEPIDLEVLGLYTGQAVHIKKA